MRGRPDLATPLSQPVVTNTNNQLIGDDVVTIQPTTSLAPTTGMRPWVAGINQFQKLYLVNKAALELLGHDVPLIALAKNKAERQERYFRQSLVFFFVFVIAPLHARLLAHAFGHQMLPTAAKHAMAQQGIAPWLLMKLPSSLLRDSSTFKTRFSQAYQTQFQKPVPDALKRLLKEPFRQSMVNAKTHFFMADLALQGAFFMSLGWIKNMFAKLFLTGSLQFSGERGIVEQQKLDQLYETQQEKLSKFKKGAMATAIGITVPALVGLALRRSLLPTRAPKGVLGFFRKHAGSFDYSYLGRWPLVSMVPFGIVGYLNDVGDIMNARSKREALENTIKIGLSTLFIFGDLMWMNLFSRLFPSKAPIPARHRAWVQKSLDWTLAQSRIKRWSPQLTRRLIDRVTTRSALSYLASFALNTSLVALTVKLMNRTTRQTLKADIQRMEYGSYQKKRLNRI